MITVRRLVAGLGIRNKKIDNWCNLEKVIKGVWQYHNRNLRIPLKSIFLKKTFYIGVIFK